MSIPSDIFHASFFFVDIVGLSKPGLSTQTQAEKIKFLNRCVSQNSTFHSTPSEEKIIQSTGDGMVIAFKQGLEKPIELAIDIHKQILEYNKNKVETEKIDVRIGCNVGNVFLLKDIQENLTMWGPGVIIAKRVMDVGDGGHILISSNMAERLNELSDNYKKIIHPLKDFTIKHQEELLIYSVYGNNFGNPNNPKLKIPKTTDQSEEIHELRKSISFKHLEYNLKVKDPKNNLLKIERTYYVENNFDNPIYEVINGITTNEPITFDNLNVKVLDEHNQELKIKRIHVESPLRKEFSIKFSQPVFKEDKNRYYSLFFEVKESKSTHEHFFLINSKQLTVNFSFPSNYKTNPKLFIISREDREKKMQENKSYLKHGIVTQVTWKIPNGVSEKDIMKIDW